MGIFIVITFISLSRAMNFFINASGTVASGSISPEALGQINTMFGGMLAAVFGGLMVVR
jgi:transcription termination factor Rho